MSGEHAVVHGCPAVVAAVDRQITFQARWKKIPKKTILTWLPQLAQIGAIELLGRLRSLPTVSIELESTIPIGAGMGSSAALAVGLSALLLRLLEKPLDHTGINTMAYQLEKFAHGQPSGADNTIVTQGGLLRFQREADGRPQFSNLPQPKTWPELFAINTGKPEETTGEMVKSVRELLAAQPQKKNILEKIGAVTGQFISWLNGDDRENLTNLIRENEHLLEELGVVSHSTIDLIRAIEKSGGSAKISGAGGKRGASGMVLATHPRPDVLTDLFKQKSLDFFPVVINANGIIIEEE